MTPNMLQIGNDQIATYTKGDSGPAIFFIHGNSSSASSFQHQFDSTLAETHRLAAIDLPGHGNSADASDPEAAYSLAGYSGVIAQTAQQLGMEDAMFVGWSLGGHILLEASGQLEQARGFVIFGTPPIGIPPAMGHAFRPNPAMNVGFTPTVTEEQARAYTDAFFQSGTPSPDSFVADVMRTDGRARAQVGAGIMAMNYLDEIEIVAGLAQPLAVLHGANEQLVNDEYISELSMPTLWRNAIQQMQNAGHAPHWEQSDEFNKLLAAFVDDTNA